MIRHRLRHIGLCTLLFLTPLPALATPAPAIAQAQTQPSTAVPTPDSPQAIAELHALLRNAYDQGAAASAAQAHTAPQRPVLAAWVEVLRNAILTIGSATFIAAWGFAIGMVLLGIAALIFSIRWRRS